MPTISLTPTSEAARILGVSLKTVYRMAESGELQEVAKSPGIRGARFFLREDVERLARARAAAATAESERILASLEAAAS